MNLTQMHLHRGAFVVEDPRTAALGSKHPAAGLASGEAGRALGGKLQAPLTQAS